MSTDRPQPRPPAEPAPVGVIGGSGLYRLFDGPAELLEVATPYGPPSGPVALGSFAGRTVAFLTRHGAGHTVPPHRINYRANVWALASLGVTAIVSSSAVGGIAPECRPGRFVLPDQFIDRTWGRADTYFDGTAYDAGTHDDGTAHDDGAPDPGVVHLAAADPYCPALRAAAASALAGIGEDALTHGTSAVIQGPRFSTRAESRWLAATGAHIVNMTQYPEVALAAELNVGTVNLSFVTDSDAGDAGAPGADDVDAGLVLRRLDEAQPRILAAIAAIVRSIPADYAPRELVPPAAVAAVLARAPRPAPGAEGVRL